jgi:hypothetical protein
MKLGRHALLSRGWGIKDKRAYGVANDPVEVRILLLQQLLHVLPCGVMKLGRHALLSRGWRFGINVV